MRDTPPCSLQCLGERSLKSSCGCQKVRDTPPGSPASPPGAHECHLCACPESLEGDRHVKAGWCGTRLHAACGAYDEGILWGLVGTGRCGTRLLGVQCCPTSAWVCHLHTCTMQSPWERDGHETRPWCKSHLEERAFAVNHLFRQQCHCCHAALLSGGVHPPSPPPRRIARPRAVGHGRGCR